MSLLTLTEIRSNIIYQIRSVFLEAVEKAEKTQTQN